MAANTIYRVTGHGDPLKYSDVRMFIVMAVDMKTDLLLMGDKHPAVQVVEITQLTDNHVMELS